MLTESEFEILQSEFCEKKISMLSHLTGFHFPDHHPFLRNDKLEYTYEINGGGKVRILQAGNRIGYTIASDQRLICSGATTSDKVDIVFVNKFVKGLSDLKISFGGFLTRRGTGLLDQFPVFIPEVKSEPELTPKQRYIFETIMESIDSVSKTVIHGLSVGRTISFTNKTKPTFVFDVTIHENGYFSIWYKSSSDIPRPSSKLLERLEMIPVWKYI